MFSLTCFVLLLSIIFIDCIQIPFIQNFTLIPRYKSNSTIITNRTCEECLCLSLPSFVAFNCFSNKTCQLFYTFPVSYKIQSTPQARLYFPQRIFPNASQCCMPDLADLLDRLKNGTWISTNVTDARNLLIDNNGYLVTVEMQPPKLVRFDAKTLTLIDRTSVTGSYLMAIGYANNAYYAGLISGPIITINSSNLTIVKSITSPFFLGIRGIIFLNNGRTMVVTSNSNRTIVFLNRNGNVSSNYTFAYQKVTNYVGVHGLTSYNDSYFYATSYNNNSVYSYTAVENSTSWTEKLVLDATPVRNISGGTFITVDECGRYWYSLETSILQIFDPLGSWIGNFNLGNGTIIDTLITNNYVMYFADRAVNRSRIVRIDPHIQC